MAPYPHARLVLGTRRNRVTPHAPLILPNTEMLRPVCGTAVPFPAARKPLPLMPALTQSKPAKTQPDTPTLATPQTRVYIINVGANSSHHPLRSVVYEDGRFELVPIPEPTEPDNSNKSACSTSYKRYRDCRAYNTNHPLCDVVPIPERYLDRAVHDDPDFDTMTYGDTLTGRGRALTQVRQGDWLLFLANLVPLDAQYMFKAFHGLFLVGLMVVDTTLSTTQATPIAMDDARLTRFAANAHVIAHQAQQEAQQAATPYLDNTLLMAGLDADIAPWQRFEKAVPFSRQIIHELDLRDGKGQPWQWTHTPDGQSTQSELMRVNVYTRTPRAHLCFDRSEDAPRLKQLWSILKSYNTAMPDWRSVAPAIDSPTTPPITPSSNPPNRS